MSLEIKLTEAMKESMKKKDSETLNALRGIKAAFTNLNTSGKEITEDIRLKELQKMVKQRHESASIFKDNNRTDLYNKEMFEISIIENFLPKQLSKEEIEKEINLTINETGASSIKDMGKVIGLVTKKLVGKADGKMISEITKKILS